MGVSRKRALDYAEKLMERPRGAIRLQLRRGKSGTTLLHDGKAVTRCYANRLGEAQASEVAKALGVQVPELGEHVDVTVPNGTFFRAIAISALDLRIPGIDVLLERYQEEAAMSRGLGSFVESAGH